MASSSLWLVPLRIADEERLGLSPPSAMVEWDVTACPSNLPLYIYELLYIFV
jgi:hypothetical protein